MLESLVLTDTECSVRQSVKALTRKGKAVEFAPHHGARNKTT